MYKELENIEEFRIILMPGGDGELGEEGEGSEGVDEESNRNIG